MNRTIVCAVLCIGLPFGCDGKGGSEAKADEAKTDEAVAKGDPPAAPEPSKQEAPPPDPRKEAKPAKKVDPADVVKEELEEIGEAGDDAKAAKDGSACEAAYTELEGMLKGGANKPPGAKLKAEMPSKADFLLGCNKLPANVQDCLRVSVLMKDAARCKADIEALPDKLRKEVEAIMQRGSK